MGSRTRFTIASVVSLAAAAVPLAALSACDDGETIQPAYPIEGGPGERPVRDVNQPPVEDGSQPADPDAAVDAGTCEALGAQVDVRRVSDDPNPTPGGGAVVDGTYRLTDAVYSDMANDAGVAFKRAGYMKFAGKNIVWSYDTDSAGNPKPTCCIGTWSFNGGYVMSMKVTCNGKPGVLGEVYDFFPTGVDAGADAAPGAPQVMIHVGQQLHDIYTKQ